ncbi:MAG: septum formation protein Maf [Sinobacteraceae bacterium]|nr:septum formation protein Maf [Nevskiaceae bacterium]
MFLEGDSDSPQGFVTALILASTSPYRKQLLSRLALPFETHAPEVDEAHLEGESPTNRAHRLALEKARAVAGMHPDAVVIGADQVAACGDQILDKPGNAQRAREQLEALSARTALFYTACAVLGGNRAVRLAHLDTTRVVFRALSQVEIERYVARERPFDCAGGFRAEALGISLFESIESRDPTALIGLPLVWLAAALRAAGFLLP